MNVVHVRVGGQPARPAQPELSEVEQHFMTIFGVPDPDVLVPDPSVWETDRKWWHGGVGGLEPGELLLPFDTVGAVPYFGGGEDTPGCLWVTTDETWARYYASAVPGGGDLYRVRPRGLMLDLDNPVPYSQLAGIGRRFRGGHLLTMGALGNHACACAVILEVAERNVPPQAHGVRQRTGAPVVPVLPKDRPPLVRRTARRVPLPPPRDTAGPYRICCVCSGNICRSAMAEVVLRDQLARAGLSERVTVDSAGVAAEQGQPMDPQARALLQRRGYGDAATHRGRQCDRSHVAGRDLVLAMDTACLAVLQTVDPQPPDGRIRLFGEAGGLGGAQIPNPWHGPDAGFAIVLTMIETAAAAIVSQAAAALGLPGKITTRQETP